jgi:hypothetical protein
LEAELTASAGLGVGNAEPSIHLYGFADFTYVRQLGKRSATGPLHPTFAMGNANLYVAAQINESWRSLLEVRFLYLPGGSIPSINLRNPAAVRTDTATPDPSDVNRPLRWGGIEIERLWLEHTVNQYLSVRAGQWLSPYGIWNVDHGSPVFIPTIRPYMIGEGLIPERQTGVEAYGSVFIEATQLGYHLTLSNGRGPIDAYQDLDDNKALGGRLFVKNDSLLGTLSLGASGYRGTYTDRSAQLTTISAEGRLVINEPVASSYEELVFAADLKWEWGNLLVQSEAIVSDNTYGDDRPVDPAFSGGPPGFGPDLRRSGVYGLFGYRTPWWNTMPYFLYSYFDDAVVPTDAWIFGLNVRPTPAVVWKVEYTHVVFHEGSVLPDYGQLTNVLAWSF